MNKTVRIQKLFYSITVFFVIVLMIGCGDSSKSEQDVAEEVAQQDLAFSWNDLSLDSYIIDKRQTNKDDKTDYVWLNIKGSNEMLSYNADYKATYVLYNDGWRLEELEEISSSYSALKYPEEELIQNDVPQKYSNIHFIQKMNQGNNMIKFCFNGDITDYDVTETYEIELTYDFSLTKGWDLTDIYEEYIEKRFNILGEWQYEDKDHLYYIHVAETNNDKAKCEYALLNKNVFSHQDGWRFNNSQYKTFTLVFLDEEKYELSTTNVNSKNVKFGDNDSIFFFNSSEDDKRGFYVGNFCLERISTEIEDFNYPEELTKESKTYEGNYNDSSTLPEEVFDSEMLEKLDYLFIEKKDLHLHRDLASDSAGVRYPIGDGLIAGNKVSLNLWTISDDESLMLETKINIGYSDLKDRLGDVFDTNVYESNNSFSFIIPNTEIVMTTTNYNDYVDVCLWPRRMKRILLTEDQIAEPAYPGKEKVIRYCEKGDIDGALKCIQRIEKDDVKAIEKELNTFISQYEKWLGKWSYSLSNPKESLWIRMGYRNGIILQFETGVTTSGESIIYDLLEGGNDYVIYHSDRFDVFTTTTIKYISEDKIQVSSYSSNTNTSTPEKEMYRIG